MKSKILQALICFGVSCHSLPYMVSAQSCTNLSGTISTQSRTSSCSGDGIADIVNVTVSGNRGTNYAIVLTDAFDKIEKIFSTTSFDMEGWSGNVYNVRGISYEQGIANLQVGKSLSQLSGCFAISNTGFTVTIFNKEAGEIRTQGGKTDTTICVNDGKPDAIQLKHTGLDAFGMMFVLTNTSDIITSVNFNIPNLEGTGTGIVKLWIVTSCLETFILPTGIPIASLGGTLDYSNAVTITKRTNCGPVCAPEAKACPGKVLMCINNVSTCVAEKDVNKKLKAGGKLGGCIICTPSNPDARSKKPVISLDEDEQAEIKVYPNPVKRSFNVVLAFSGETQLRIADVSGRAVYQQKINAIEHMPVTIQLPGKVTVGMYTLTATNASNHVMQKILVE